VGHYGAFLAQKSSSVRFEMMLPISLIEHNPVKQALTHDLLINLKSMEIWLKL
jgi:hypothetical protein